MVHPLYLYLYLYKTIFHIQFLIFCTTVPAVRDQQPAAGLPDGAADGRGVLPRAAVRRRRHGRRRRAWRRRARRPQTLPAKES